MKSWQALGGAGHTEFLPFIIFSVVALQFTFVAGHGGGRDADGNCVPWKCSCYYYGIYYDKGDTWQSPDDPCITFKCVEDGLFLPVQTGCSFKGVCKNKNTTWTEGCQRYRCLVEGGFSKYILEQSGCLWKDGNCYTIGEHAIEHCDTFECQIVDGCYSMVRIKSGCLTDDVSSPCKPMYSFWQDECAVYQCTEERNDNLEARIQTHTHEVMMWPRGHYALPKPDTGCPEYSSNLWRDGMYLQCGDGCNFKSQEFSLEGNYTKVMFDHHFCVHHDVNDQSLMPLYQTYWEAGRYCILKYNGSCPRGFEEGYVQMNNKDCSAGNISRGHLPDGNFSSLVTRMEFCCRYDGKIEHPIILPAKHSFVLFMAANQTQCQEVRGMQHKTQFWSFCDVKDGKMRLMNGSLPLIKTGDNNTLINFCVYSPIGCGCTNDDEEIVAVGETVTKDCVTKICKQEYHFNRMHIVQGGCFDETSLTCRLENDTWTDTEGETCQGKTCVRKVEEKTGEIYFDIIDTGMGCRDGDECYSINATKVKGCYQTQCQLDPASGLTGFRVTVAGCSDGHGGCIPDGANVTKGCITLKCNRGISSCGLSVVVGGCGVTNSDECFAVEEKVTRNCKEYTCKEYRHGKSITWKLKVTKPGCADQNGTCYKEGDLLETSCGTYKCVFGDKPGFAPLVTGCSTSIGCIRENEKKVYHCNTYNCTKLENGQKRLFREKTACSLNGACFDVGSTKNDPKTCITYKCGDDGKKVRVSVGCMYKGTCHLKLEKFKIKCSTYQCKSNDTHRWLDHLSLGCETKSGCVDSGKTYKEDCDTYKCSEAADSCVSTLIERGCKNSVSGECVDTGDTVERECGVYRCQPDGVKNPYVFVSGGCQVGNVCYKVNELVKTDDDKCKVVCKLNAPSDAMAGLYSADGPGCVVPDADRGPVCLESMKYKWTKSHDYYCIKLLCYNNKIYKQGFQCKTIDGTCLEDVKEGHPQTFNMKYNYRGTYKNCTAVCSVESSKTKVKITGCKALNTAA